MNAEVIKELKRIAEIGPLEAMLADERARGFVPVMPGTVPWLPEADWPEDIVISVFAGEVRIVAIYAKTKKSGAFSRLITNIAKYGMTPLICSPMGDMITICRRWGWLVRTEGSGFRKERIMYPTQEWLRERTLR